MRDSIFLNSLRSMWRHKGSYIACIIVLAVGMSVYIGMFSSSQRFDEVSEDFYAQSNFADAFASILSMPKSDLNRIKQIKGVKDVQGTLTESAKCILDDGTLISVSLVGTDLKDLGNMNQYTYTGLPLVHQNDIWLDSAFYNHYHYQPGDTIDLIVSGSQQTFTICGIMTSPEYLGYGNGESSAIGFVQSSMLERLMNSTGLVTEISMKLDKDVAYSDIEQTLKYELKKYGLISLLPKQDQGSYGGVKQNVATISSIATMMPFLFLLISVIMLYIMLKRFVEQGRGEIGTLKAFGYTNTEIILGYFVHGTLTGLLGFLLALMGGWFIGDYYYKVMLGFFTFPAVKFTLPTGIWVKSFLISVVVSNFAAYLGARSITKIQPAEAMRASAPSAKKGGWKSDSKLIKCILNPRGIMGLRGISRSKWRSMLTVFSIIVSFSLTSVLIAFSVTFEKIIMVTFEQQVTYDMSITLNKFTPLTSAIQDVEQLNGVLGAEGMFSVPVTFYHENKSKKDVSITGISDTSKLYKIVDQYYNVRNVPAKGIALNSRTAESLNAHIGDVIEVESPRLRKNVNLLVTDIIPISQGNECFMEIVELSKLFGDQTLCNQVIFNTTPEYMDSLEKELIKGINVSSVMDVNNQKRIAREGTSATFTLIYLLVIMSLFMSFGVIYNVSRISLAEKQRELATMRIIGFTVGETAEVNSFEHWILFVLGCLGGFFLSLWMKGVVGSAFSNEYMTLIINLSLKSTLYAFISCMGSVLLSNLMAKRAIGKYQLVEVLKERE